MDKSQCERIVDSHLTPLMIFMGLADRWTIHVEFCPLSGAAEFDGNMDYNQGTIRFDSKAFDSEDFIIDSIFHELSHVIGSPFRLMEKLFLKTRPDLEDTIRSITIHCNEQHVINLERIWQSHLRDLYIEFYTKLR